MARPPKKGVDYFSHDCISGKTLFIVEQKFGNDGYAFWYKLLEFLGTKEGHFLDCNNVADMEFLQAKTRLDDVSIMKILDLLAGLDAIDQELWQQNVVWSQGFVDRISDVYVNRRQKTPDKPSFYSSKPQITEVSTSKSTQSKVKESKGKETKEELVTPNGVTLASAEADAQREVKKEYEKLCEEYTGKEQREVYQAIKKFVEEKRPTFAEPYVDAWNIFAPSNGLESVRSITIDRRNKIRIRTREPEFDFFKILVSIRQNSFYRGENDRQWKVEFNYVIESQAKYIPILERFKEN
jgi:hypothetical protein